MSKRRAANPRRSPLVVNLIRLRRYEGLLFSSHRCYLKMTSTLSHPEYLGGLSSDSSLNGTDWSFRRLKARDKSPSTQLSGKGEDDTPRSPKKKIHRKSRSVQLNGDARPKAQNASDLIEDQQNAHSQPNVQNSSDLVEEDFKDRNGDHLTTLRRADTELVSGRRAGAGWEISQWVSPPTATSPPFLLNLLTYIAHTAYISHLSRYLSSADYKLLSFSLILSASLL